MTSSQNIRLATKADAEAVSTILIETGLTEEGDGSALEPMDENHTWIVLEDECGVVIGAAYFGPESHSDRVWNLYALAVTKQRQGRGRGTALVTWAEENLRARGTDVAKLLLIDTSSVDSFELTRAFYLKLGYVEEARVRNYYGDNDDKVTYWKNLTATSPTDLNEARA